MGGSTSSNPNSSRAKGFSTAMVVVVLVEVVELSSVTGSEDSTVTSSAIGSADEHEIKIKVNKVNKNFLIGF